MYSLVVVFAERLPVDGQRFESVGYLSASPVLLQGRHEEVAAPGAHRQMMAASVGLLVSMVGCLCTLPLTNARRW